MSTFGTDTSGPTLGAGREADVYAMGDSAVLKLYRPGFGGHRAEAITLRSLEGRGIAPKLLEVREVGGRTGLLEERLAGPDLLTLLQHRPWRLYGVARLMTEAHLAIHRVPAPAELADNALSWPTGSATPRCRGTCSSSWRACSTSCPTAIG